MHEFIPRVPTDLELALELTGKFIKEETAFGYVRALSFFDGLQSPSADPTLWEQDILQAIREDATHGETKTDC